MNDFNDLDRMLGVPPRCASILDVHAALDDKCLGDLVTQGKGVEVCCNAEFKRYNGALVVKRPDSSICHSLQLQMKDMIKLNIVLIRKR